MSEIKNFNDLMNSPEWQELTRLQLEAKDAKEEEYDAYWDSLSYENQLASFYSVVKRIYQGEIKDRGSYRWVLYDVFGFGPEAYTLGMDCGYMYLHNAIFDGEEVNNKLATEK
jgi:hypothetical protein